MRQPENGPRLIHSRRGAIVALCFTGYIAALSFRDLFSAPHHAFHWLLDLSFLRLPAWGIIALNLALYACLLWIAIATYRGTQKRERILVAGWCACGLLGPLQGLVSPFTAAMIDYLQALAMAAAWIAAVCILKEIPRRSMETEAADFEAGDTTTIALLAAALNVGLMIAFVDSRPTWDDTGITLVALALSSGVLGLMGPRRPWLWALAVWAWMPVFNWISPRYPERLLHQFAFPSGLAGNPAAKALLGTLGILLFSLAGAYAGMFLRALWDKAVDTANRTT